MACPISRFSGLWNYFPAACILLGESFQLAPTLSDFFGFYSKLLLWAFGHCALDHFSCTTNGDREKGRWIHRVSDLGEWSLANTVWPQLTCTGEEVTDVLSGRVFYPSKRPSALTYQQFGDEGCSSFPWIVGILYKDLRTKVLNLFLFSLMTHKTTL